MIAECHECVSEVLQLCHEGRLKHWSSSHRVCQTCFYAPALILIYSWVILIATDFFCYTLYINCAVNLEIFIVKIFSESMAATKVNLTKHC